MEVEVLERRPPTVSQQKSRSGTFQPVNAVFLVLPVEAMAVIIVMGMPYDHHSLAIVEEETVHHPAHKVAMVEAHTEEVVAAATVVVSSVEEVTLTRVTAMVAHRTETNLVVEIVPANLVAQEQAEDVLDAQQY